MRKVRFGRTGLEVTPIGFGGYPLAGVNRARGWDPYSADGRRAAVATIHHALDAGVNYVDTAPGYGDGHSERLIGEVMAARRAECVLATKVAWKDMDHDAVVASVEASLGRLRTDHVDVVQLHGGIFGADDVRHILEGGPLHGLETLRGRGLVRFLGVTTEEPYSALGLIRSGAFDVVQLAYNLIYQGAALHALPEAHERDLGVVTMRTMTSGIFQRLVAGLAPSWADDSYRVCLEFVLGDSRVHVANVGMRWADEVDRNVAAVERFEPPFDFAELPRMTVDVYRAEDLGAGARG
jgi:aryl-alcohol dehydrogenase-like predicted oxidoreductase